MKELKKRKEYVLNFLFVSNAFFHFFIVCVDYRHLVNQKKKKKNKKKERSMLKGAAENNLQSLAWEAQPIIIIDEY